MAISLSDLKKRLKAATLDKTTLDERFVKTVKDAGRGYQIGGRILSNQIQKRVGEPVRQWAASTSPQNVGRSIRDNPTQYIPFSQEFMRQGVQSGQNLLNRTTNPIARAGISTGQEFIKNYQSGFKNLSQGVSQRKPGQVLTGAWQTVSPSLAMAGGVKPALAMAGLGGGLGAGVAKLTGQDSTTAFGKGANEGFRTRAVTRFTDPRISKIIDKVSPTTGLFKRQLVQRGVSAVGNFAEDEIIALFEGYKNKASDRALSLLMGASMAGNIELSKSLKNSISQALSKTGTSKKRAVRKVIAGIENSGGVQRIVRGTRTFLRNGNKLAGSEKTTGDTIKLKNNVTAQQLGNKIRIRSVAPVSGRVSTKDFDTDVIRGALDTNTRLGNYSASDIKKINEARFLLGNENLQSMQGAVAGVEPYQDENGNWKVRYNPTKGMIGVGVMGGIKAVRNSDVQDANQAIRDMFPSDSINLINKLKRAVGASKDGDVTEWVIKNEENQKLYNKVVEAVREVWGDIDEADAIEKAMNIPTKASSKSSSVIKVKNAEAKVRLDRLLNDGTRLLRMGYTPEQISKIGAKRAKEIVDQDIQPIRTGTYNSELDLKTSDIQNKKVQSQADRQIKDEFDNWEKALGKQVGATKKTIDDRVKSISDMMMDDYISKKTVKDKVNLLDYVRTPDRVLNKIGLKPESDMIRAQYQAYEQDLPKQLDIVNSWYERVGKSKEASERIFRYLDGEKLSLKGEELKVASEIRKYLDDWADKLDIPKEKRIANYITHVFKDAITGKEFDESLEKLIADRIPGSVYDPFLLARQGVDGYVKDAFTALDAYVKRASRKYHMDPALERVREASETLDKQSLDYVKAYIDKINMRPSNIDKMIDNLVKSSPVGYRLGQRPTARVTRSLRNWVYRGTLGLNVGSALRNLTQGVNTYAQLGEKYTGIGYIKAMRDIASGSKELEESGVLGGQFIQDRNISAFKSLSEKLDKGLWVFFDAAERINRGSAYFGAKAKALDAGLSEKEAIQAGIDMARKTQFTFGSVDTPQLLQSDIAKSLLQFQSFNLKQAEMLGEMLRGKEYKKFARYAGAWAVLLYAAGELFGWEWSDAVPFGSDLAQGESRIGKTPTIQGLTGAYKASINAPDMYGNTSDEKNPLIRIAQSKDVQDALVAHFPAGVQIKKTIGGLRDVNRGYSETKTGRVRFPISQNAGNYIKAGTLGTWKLKEGQEYFDKNRSVLGEKQSETFKKSTPEQRISMYQSILENRDKKSQGTGNIAFASNNQIKIPSNQKQFNEFYSDALSKGTGFLDEKRSIEYDPTLSEAEKLDKIQKLQEKMIPWSNALAEMRNGYPEKVFEAEIVTYGKDHPADIKVEDRAKWAVSQLKSKSDEEKQKLINRFWEEGVLTGKSNGVAQFIEDNYDLNVWKYTGTDKKARSASGKAKKIKLGTTPTINTKPIRFTPSQAPQQRISLRLPQSRGQQTIPVMKATKPSIDLRRVRFG